jgi:hypothetical protein
MRKYFFSCLHSQVEIATITSVVKDFSFAVYKRL